MRFREKCPHWETLPTEALLKQAGFAVLNALIHRIAEWYQVNLPMWAVLQHVGYRGDSGSHGGPRYPLIGPDTDEVQVSCMLPTHGEGGDRAPSARYYLFDRNQLTSYGHIYCYGSACQKAYTSFWYLYVMLKFHRKARISDVILYIEHEFQVPFPRDILLNADPERLTDDAQAQAIERELAQRFTQAWILRTRVRPENKAQYLAALAALYTSPLQCTAAAE